MVVVVFVTNPQRLESNPQYLEFPDRYQTPPLGDERSDYEPGGLDIIGRLSDYFYLTYDIASSILPNADGIIENWQIVRTRPIQQAVREGRQFPANVSSWQVDWRFDINESY